MAALEFRKVVGWRERLRSEREAARSESMSWVVAKVPQGGEGSGRGLSRKVPEALKVRVRVLRLEARARQYAEDAEMRKVARERSRVWWYANHERALAALRVRYRRWYENNRDHVLAASRRRREQLGELIKARYAELRESGLGCREASRISKSMKAYAEWSRRSMAGA